MIASLAVQNLPIILLFAFSLFRLINFASTQLADDEFQDSETENQNNFIKEQKPSQQNVSEVNSNVEVAQIKHDVVVCNVSQQSNEGVSTESIISEEVPMSFEAIQIECGDSQKSQQSTIQGQVNCLNLSSNEELQSSQISQSRSAQNSVQATSQKIKKIKKQKKLSKRKAKMSRLQKQIKLLS